LQVADHQDPNTEDRRSQNRRESRGAHARLRGRRLRRISCRRVPLRRDAEYQAALCVEAVAWLLKFGWSLPALQILVEHLQAQGFVQRVVEHVYEQSPEHDYGHARVKGYRFGGELHAELPHAHVTSFTIEED